MAVFWNLFDYGPFWTCISTKALSPHKALGDVRGIFSYI